MTTLCLRIPAVVSISIWTTLHMADGNHPYVILLELLQGRQEWDFFSTCHQVPILWPMYGDFAAIPEMLLQ